ncbi:Serine/threonine-protein kinase Nek6 [Sorochytrium milnesiophthora]
MPVAAAPAPAPSTSTGNPKDDVLSLDSFEVEKKIGKGQFSTVFRAKDKRSGDVVALKRMQIGEMDEKARNDCLKEIDLLKSLKHPNIIQPIASFLSLDELILVLEMADAGDLGQMVKHFKTQNKLIPEKTVWKYFLQIASGLSHMHSCRIMHRDLKPANIFLTSKGVVKLGDLGLGRFFSPKTFAAQSLVGTPYYMSPERIHEQEYDFKSDIWSLGCILYELCALQSPFWGDKLNIYGLCKKIDAVDYPPLKEDEYSSTMRHLIADMIQLKPSKRPDCAKVVQVATAMHKKHFGTERPFDDAKA